MITGLSYFTDLVEELDQAISGAKYGDYIMEGGASVGKAPLHHTRTCNLGHPLPYHANRLLWWSGSSERENEGERYQDDTVGRKPEGVAQSHQADSGTS